VANCTTTIQRLARSGERRSWWSWKLVLNGYLDPRFSVRIREGLPWMSLDRGGAGERR